MSLPLITRPPLGGCGDLGDPIEYSCSFGGKGYLSRAHATGNRKKWALFVRLKLGAIGSQMTLLSGYAGQSRGWVVIYPDGTLQLHSNGAVYRRSIAFLRDPGGHASLLVHLDTDATTEAGRFRAWLDDRELPMTISASIAQGGLMTINTASQHEIAKEVGASGASDFIASELAFFDGFLPAPTDFGYVTAHGSWADKRFGGLGGGAAIYGATGYHLDFTDPLDLGKDVSGNGNHWTATGLTADNQVTDTPTRNFPILNPLSASSGLALSNGNLDHYSPNASYAPGAIATTLLPTSGKWIWASTTTGNDYPLLGVVRRHANPRSGPGPAKAWAVRPGVSVCLDGVISYTTIPFSQAAGDEFHMAYDADAGTLEFFKNGVSTGYKITDLPSGLAVYSAGVINKAKLNFGQRPFSYPPPPDFKTLDTASLPCPDILNPDDYFTIRLTTGGADITDLPWNPLQHKTLVVSKRRDTSSDWRAVDTVNGTGRMWAPNNSTSGLVAEADGLTAFIATGYTIGTNSTYQGDRVDYVWRASRKAGFDIIGPVNHVNGAPTTVPHAVGGVVDYAWVVRADAGQDRRVFHKGLPSGDYRCLNNKNPAVTDAGWFSSSANDLALGATLPSGKYIIYAWRGVPGFSAFETHKGTDSTDAFFQPLDFSPRLFITDQYDRWSTGGAVSDIDRSPENPIIEKLQLTLSEKAIVSAGYTNVDALSNGLKCRCTESGWSESGFNYIDAAWAKTPFKFARAR